MVVRREAKDVSALPKGNRDVLWLGQGDVPPALGQLAKTAGLRLHMRTEQAWPAPRIALLDELGNKARAQNSLENRRVAVLHPDPGSADALAEAVRAKGARAVVLSLSEVGITRAEALDPEVIVMSPTHMVGACANMVDALWNHPRMRWTPMLLVPDRRLGPAGLNAPDVRELAIAVDALCKEHVALERRVQREQSFEFSLHEFGPIRALRALIESGRALRVVFHGAYLVVEVDVAEGIVVGARAGEEKPDEEMLLGVHALTALFTETKATVRVRRVERPAATNIMAPLDALLLGDRKTPAFISDVPASNTQSVAKEEPQAHEHHEPETLRPPPKTVPFAAAKPRQRVPQKTPGQGVAPAPTLPQRVPKNTPARGIEPYPAVVAREPQKTPGQGVGPLPTRAAREPQKTPGQGIGPVMPPPPALKPQATAPKAALPPPAVREHGAGLPALRAPGEAPVKAAAAAPRAMPAMAGKNTLLMAGPPRAPLMPSKPGRPGPLPRAPEKLRTSELEDAIAHALDEHARPTREVEERKTRPNPIDGQRTEPSLIEARKTQSYAVEPSRSPVMVSKVIATREEPKPVLRVSQTPEADDNEEPETTEIEVSVSESPPPPQALTLPRVQTQSGDFESAKTVEFEASPEDEPTLIGSATHLESEQSSSRRAMAYAAAALCVIAIGAGAWRVMHTRSQAAGAGQVARAEAPLSQTKREVAAATPEQESQADGQEPAPAEPAQAPSSPTQGTEPGPMKESVDDAVERDERPLSEVSPEALARADDLVLDGHQYKRRGDLANARATYEKALSVVPGYPRALFGVAETLLAQGEKQRALDTTLSLLKRRKRFPDDYRLLGDIHVAMGNTDAAIEAYRVASQGGSRAARDKLRTLR